MPSSLQRPRRINTSVEKKILTGMIVSTKFLNKIKPMVKPEYFTIDYSKDILKWVLDYHALTNEAPRRHIQDIFNTERDNLTPARSRLVASYLDNLSTEYISARRFNVDFVTARARRYFRTQALRNLGEGVVNNVNSGKIRQAENLVRGFAEIATDTGQIMDFFDSNTVANLQLNRSDSGLFQFGGEIGKLIGPYQRGWLAGILAPMKRGKTWMLIELAMQALMADLTVLFVSLEMPVNDIMVRFAQRLTGFYLPRSIQEEETPPHIKYPLFDCEYNQDNTCNFRHRTNDRGLFDDEGDEIENYNPCTYCRDNDPGMEEIIYEPTIFDAVQTDITKLTKMRLRRQLATFKNMYQSKLFIRSFPAFSATVSDVKSVLSDLYNYQGVVVDIVVPDYADIFATEREYGDTRAATDHIWKSLKGLASERECLVATASQSTRRSIDRTNVRMTDVAEDIRKIAHVDEMFSLNQKPSERRQGVMRISEIAHRHKEFDEAKQALVTQCLALGQPVLDSEPLFEFENYDEDEEE